MVISCSSLNQLIQQFKWRLLSLTEVLCIKIQQTHSPGIYNAIEIIKRLVVACVQEEGGREGAQGRAWAFHEQQTLPEILCW